MKFDTPATTNPIDQLKVIGRPSDRIDGRYKTTGTAPYAYERHDVAPSAAYGYVVGAAIAKGRVRSINVDEAGMAKRIARTPIGRLGQVEDVANIACFLASDESGFITGESMLVDGGVTHALL